MKSFMGFTSPRCLGVTLLKAERLKFMHMFIKASPTLRFGRKLLDVSEKALELLPQDWNSDVIILDQVKALIETGELSKAEEKLNAVAYSQRKFIINRKNELKREITLKKR